MSDIYKTTTPGFTNIPDIFFERIFETLKENEMRVLLIIIRNTFGEPREFDVLSSPIIMRKTEMTKCSVTRALKSLLAKGIIVRKDGYGEKWKDYKYKDRFSYEISEDLFTR